MGQGDTAQPPRQEIETPGRRDGLRAYTLLILAVLAAGVAAGTSRLALAKMLRDDLGASMLLVSSLTSWFMLARALSSAVGGLGVLSSPRAWRLLLSLPLVGIAVVVYTISTSANLILILGLNAVWGLLSGLVWPQAQAAAGVALHSRPGAAVSVYFATGTLGLSIGQYIYGVIDLDNASMVRLSSLLFLASAALMAVASGMIPRPAPRGMKGLKAAKIRGIDRVSAWIILAAFSTGYTAGILREFLYVYLGEVFDLSRSELGSLLAASGLAALAASLVAGPAADRLGTTRVLSTVLLVGALGGLMLGFSYAPWQALLGLMLAQAAARSSMPLTRNIAAFNHPQALAFVGFSNTFSSIGQMTGPLAAGLIYDRIGEVIILGLPGAGLPFITAGVLLAATVAAYRIAVRSSRR